MSNEQETMDQLNEEIKELGSYDFDHMEDVLEQEISDSFADLKLLETDRQAINNPESLSDAIGKVVWEQFYMQIGVDAGEEFIDKNHGLTLDLRDKAHIQTEKNFKKGVIATHNYKSRENLEYSYDRLKNTPHNKFRKEFVNPGMDAALERAGELNKKGIETVTDIYSGKKIPTATKLENGKNNPKAAQREHVNASAEIYQDPGLQMGTTDQDLANIINNPENLQGYTTAERNNRKSDKSSNDMEGRDKTKHYEKAKKRADKFKEKKKKEIAEKLKKEGRKTQKEEAKRIADETFKAIFLALLADLLKTIIGKLVIWFKSTKRKLDELIEYVKSAVQEFFCNVKARLKTTADVGGTTVLTAIFGPVVRTLKKAWIFIKQAGKSLKQAFEYFRNPANSSKPFKRKIMEVGKIVVAGLAAGGSIFVGDLIEKGLMSIPFFAIEIPLLGSIANILGIFLGGVICGLLGAIVINFIDSRIAQREKQLAVVNEITQQNEVIKRQNILTHIVVENTKKKIHDTGEKIKDRHNQAKSVMKGAIENIFDNDQVIKGNDDRIREDSNEMERNSESVKKKLKNLDDLLTQFE